MSRILTGIQSTGTPHLGNILGAIIPAIEKSINNVLDSENKKRREQLKKFNYNFKSSSTRIDEMEKEPAYKRFGLDLDENSKTSEVSNLTIDQDVNDETQIRTNNSFLHDNVD